MPLLHRQASYLLVFMLASCTADRSHTHLTVDLHTDGNFLAQLPRAWHGVRVLKQCHASSAPPNIHTFLW